MPRIQYRGSSTASSTVSWEAEERGDTRRNQTSSTTPAGTNARTHRERRVASRMTVARARNTRASPVVRTLATARAITTTARGRSREISSRSSTPSTMLPTRPTWKAQRMFSTPAPYTANPATPSADTVALAPFRRARRQSRWQRMRCNETVTATNGTDEANPQREPRAANNSLGSSTRCSFWGRRNHSHPT
jgi:hypothetical protein